LVFLERGHPVRLSATREQSLAVIRLGLNVLPALADRISAAPF